MKDAQQVRASSRKVTLGWEALHGAGRVAARVVSRGRRLALGWPLAFAASAACFLGAAFARCRSVHASLMRAALLSAAMAGLTHSACAGLFSAWSGPFGARRSVVVFKSLQPTSYNSLAARTTKSVNGSKPRGLHLRCLKSLALCTLTFPRQCPVS